MITTLVVVSEESEELSRKNSGPHSVYTFAVFGGLMLKHLMESGKPLKSAKLH
jgi:hypothetical protein